MTSLSDNIKPTSDDGFDPGKSNDPVAKKTQWFAQNPNFTNFQTRTATQISGHRLVLRPTLGALGFYGLFTLVGLGTLVAALTPDVAALPMLGFTLVFGGIGLTGLVKALRSPMFDRRLHRYSVGSRSQQDQDLREVHALQIVSATQGGRNTVRRTFELNLVFQSGLRTSVVSHQDLEGLRQDARTLANFLGLPLWDAEPTRPRGWY
jgi:hypothetical protein